MVEERTAVINEAEKKLASELEGHVGHAKELSLYAQSLGLKLSSLGPTPAPFWSQSETDAQ